MISLSTIQSEDLKINKHSDHEFSSKSENDHRLSLNDCQNMMVNSKRFKCSLCCYKSDRRNNLRRHVIAMHERRPHVTECCGFRFDSKASLRDHVMRSHDNGYICIVCLRTFRRKALLVRHAAVHSGRKEFVCNDCGYASCNKSNLDRHVKRHASQRHELFNVSSVQQLGVEKNGSKQTFISGREMITASSKHLAFFPFSSLRTCHRLLPSSSGSYLQSSFRPFRDIHLKAENQFMKSADDRQLVSKFDDRVQKQTIVGDRIRLRLLPMPYTCLMCFEKFSNQLSLLCHQCHQSTAVLLQCPPLSVTFRNKNSQSPCCRLCCATH